jgi:hypothetical protein
MTKVAWLCAATVLVAAVSELPACSARTGASNLIGYSSGGAAIDTAQGGAVATGGGGAGAFLSQPGSGSTPPPGAIGGVTTRPMDMGNGPDGSCGELPFMAQQATKTTTITHETPEPIDLYLMWDQSLSMSCAISSGTGGAGGMGGMGTTTAADRWDAVNAPLSAWVQSVAAEPPFNVGIGYFGIPTMFGQDPNAQCDAANYEKPDVEIGPLPQNAMAIVDSLNAHKPSTNTPTNAALQGAVNHALAWKTSHPNEVVAVVLVTDGEPNSCGSVQDVANTAAMAFNNGMGVQTFVIGVTSSGTTCFIDPDPPSVTDLDTVAMAGGTGKALVVDVAQNPEQQLTDELNMIRKSITMTTTKTEVMTSKLPCEFQIPMDVNMTNGPHVVFDKDKVNVDFTSNQGVKQSVYRVDSLDKCAGTNALGWYYDNDDMPTEVLLCPNACSQIQAPTADGGVDPTLAGMAPKVSIVLGCKSIYAPPA